MNQAFLPESLERLRAEIQGSRDPAVLARLENDMAVLFAAEGEVDAAFSGFHRAINHDLGRNVARRNLQVLECPQERQGAAESPQPPRPNGFHRAERALAEFDRRDYPARLRAAVKNAAGVLAEGRAKFEREFTWDQIIERHYRPLFGSLRRS